MARFNQALDEYSDQNSANAPRLLLLTGARSGEVLKAEWSHFNLSRGPGRNRLRTPSKRRPSRFRSRRRQWRY